MSNNLEISEMRGCGMVAIDVVDCQQNAAYEAKTTDARFYQLNVGSFATFPSHTPDRKT